VCVCVLGGGGVIYGAPCPLVFYLFICKEILIVVGVVHALGLRRR
jgi:hypothetical protein